MDNNELLLAMSAMLDTKFKSELQPIKNDLQSLKNEVQTVKSELQSEIQTVRSELHQVKLYQENVIMPRLNTIESCYIDTFKRYSNYADKMDAAFEDIEIMKKVIIGHSEKLQRIS